MLMSSGDRREVFMRYVLGAFQRRRGLRDEALSADIYRVALREAGDAENVGADAAELLAWLNG